MLVAASVAAAGVAHAAPPPPPKAVSAGGRLASSSRSTVIMGSAWAADNSPLPGAHVQLRNVVNGKIIARSVADDAGRFAFSDLEGGTYVVELVTETGKILTVGHAFAIAPGESVATFVRLGTKAPWFPNFFSNTATAVTTSAASQGVTALQPVQNPLSATSSATLTSVKK